MSAFTFSQRSRKNLSGVHPDLVKVVTLALRYTTVDFVVTEGLRTVQRQKQLVAAGASKTMNSRHITGHAVDLAALVSGEVRWDWPLYEKLADAMKDASRELDIPIEWGGDWRSFKDGPHFQLPHKEYPA
jgi:peptidoglycan L-alanyl-D-glutamate endopeptidase CwlK